MEVLRGLLQHVRVHAAAASVGCSGGVEVDERRGVLVGHGRRRRWRRRGFCAWVYERAAGGVGAFVVGRNGEAESVCWLGQA